MDKENILYLFNIAKRADYFHKVSKDTIKYIIENRIEDNHLRIELVVMSAFWAAKKIDSTLTKYDLEMFFNIDSMENDKNELFDLEIMKPLKDQVTHIELMDIIVDSASSM